MKNLKVSNVYCFSFSLIFRIQSWLTLETQTLKQTSQSVIPGSPGVDSFVYSEFPALCFEFTFLCWSGSQRAPLCLSQPLCLSLCLYAHFFISSSASRQPPKKIWDYTPGDCSILPKEDRKVIRLCLLRGLCVLDLQPWLL